MSIECQMAQQRSLELRFETSLQKNPLKKPALHRILKHSINHFEDFVTSLGHEIYFIEPLYYHNAIIFEGYGFAYQQGRRLMERIQAGFAEGGELRQKLDGSTPFRQPEAHASIRGRSWAIHDGILGQHDESGFAAEIRALEAAPQAAPAAGILSIEPDAAPQGIEALPT